MAQPWDIRIAHAATMADNCMKLGAVILKPKGHVATGFSAPKPPKGS